MAGNAFRFLGSLEGDSEEESNSGGGRWSSDDEASDGSSTDNGDDGDVPARSPKRRRYPGTYGW